MKLLAKKGFFLMLCLWITTHTFSQTTDTVDLKRIHQIWKLVDDNNIFWSIGYKEITVTYGSKATNILKYSILADTLVTTDKKKRIEKYRILKLTDLNFILLSGRTRKRVAFVLRQV